MKADLRSPNSAAEGIAAVAGGSQSRLLLAKTGLSENAEIARAAGLTESHFGT